MASAWSFYKILLVELISAKEAGFEAGLEGLKAMEIGGKQYDKEAALFGPQNTRKSRRAKMDLPSWCLRLTVSPIRQCNVLSSGPTLT